ARVGRVGNLVPWYTGTIGLAEAVAAVGVLLAPGAQRRHAAVGVDALRADAGLRPAVAAAREQRQGQRGAERARAEPNPPLPHSPGVGQPEKWPWSRAGASIC